MLLEMRKLKLVEIYHQTGVPNLVFPTSVIRITWGAFKNPRFLDLNPDLQSEAPEGSRLNNMHLKKRLPDGFAYSTFLNRISNKNRVGKMFHQSQITF